MGEFSESFSAFDSIGFPHRVALETSIQLTFKELRELVDQTKDHFRDLPKGVAILVAEQTLEFCQNFLSLYELGHPVAIFPKDLPDLDFKERQHRLGVSYSIKNGKIFGLQTQGSVEVHPKTAVLLFTSGSTATPKIVQLSRNNIEANTKACLKSLYFNKATTQGLFLPLHYSFGLLGQLLPALRSNMSTKILTNMAEVRGLFEKGELPTMWSGVPSHWETLLKLLAPFRESRHKVTHVISAGAPLSTELRTRLRESFPEAILFNNYGLTEASPRVLCLSGLDPQFFTGATGYPVGEWELRKNTEGELYIRGPQVMLGYLGEKETPNGELATGDTAEITPEQLVTILGRKDNVFKIAGERVSVEETEAALSVLPGVHQVAVLPRPDPLYGAHIIAFVVGDLDLSVCKARNLNALLMGRLSPQRIPKEYYLLEALPLKATGKIDRRALGSLIDPQKRIPV